MLAMLLLLLLLFVVCIEIRVVKEARRLTFRVIIETET